MNCNVEIIKFVITDITIGINAAPKSKEKLVVKYELSFGSPKDPSDPTALLKIKATVDNQDSLVHLSCLGESIVRFDPIPEDLESAIKENCIKLMQDEMFSRIKQLLNTMNHEFHIAANV